MMRNKKLLAAAGIMAVTGVYAYIYRDWFRPAEMQIYDRVSTGKSVKKGARDEGTAEAPAVAFGFNRRYELKDVKVIAVAELATNKHPRPLWHLISDSNSVPVKGFNYGEHIRGMHPEVKKVRAEPLAANVTYRLLVEAKGQKGQFDFAIDAPLDQNP